MSVIPQIGVCATSVTIVSSYVGDMLPHKVIYKEISEESVKEPL